MRNIKWLVTAAVVAILSSVSTVCAKGQNPVSGARSGTTVTAAATADRVRFTAPSSIVQIRLEVYAANGVKVFDNEIRGGNVIDWHLQDGQAERLTDGSYLCVITTKSLVGRITQKLGRVVIENTTAVMKAIDPAELSAQQVQAVGPVEEDAGLTLLSEGDSQTGTVIAHDGTDGQITRGRGALSFRIGDFFSGKDTEQMRLTEEGNVGIGTSEPKVKLDVAGVIGARDGLMFSDGSTLSVNRKGVLMHTSAKGDAAPSVAGTGTQNHLAKWTDNIGTLGDSGITETASGIGIGTTTPQSGLDYRNGLAPFFTRDIGTTNFGTTQSALQLGVTNVGSRNVNVGPSFLFFADNSAGAKSFLGRVSAAWENPTAGAEAGSIRFQVRANGGDTTAFTERMRITAGGNVGIGSQVPLSKLHIVSGVSDLPPRLQSAGTSSFAAGWDFYHGTIGRGYVGVPDPSAGFGAGEMLLFGGPGTKTSLWAGSNRSVTIDTNGNVGIGTTTTTLARLQVNDTSFGTGVYGVTSTNGRGVTGENTGSSNGTGVLGYSATGVGVLGQANASLFPGVEGTNTSASGIGVLGVAHANGGVGVYGQSNSNIGVYGQSTNGFAMRADGNTFQQRDKGGWVKAMAIVNADGTIGRCYNGITNSSSGNCGFSVDHVLIGNYTINFGFRTDDRFISVTPFNAHGISASNIGANIDLELNTAITIFYTDDRSSTSWTNGSFTIMVF